MLYCFNARLFDNALVAVALVPVTLIMIVPFIPPLFHLFHMIVRFDVAPVNVALFTVALLNIE